MADTGSVGELAEAWRCAVRALGGDSELAAGSGAELEHIYASPSRSYHATGHIVQVLRDSQALSRECGLDSTDTATVIAAGCAHDVVYRGHAGEDERASAQWARQALSAAGVPACSSDRVAELVLMTIDHQAPPSDLPAAVLLDADLAVLGGEPSDYGRYLASVRREYRHVGEADWRSGRAAVLRALLDREQLYLTVAGRHQWSQAARRNMQAELAALEDPDS
jgi:predicted metal-dependent HD superfamily phosphohydrolase